MVSKKDIEKGMKKAKELELHEVPSEKEIAGEYKKDMEKFDEIRRLLEPAWFISGKEKKAKIKKTKKKAKSKKK